MPSSRTSSIADEVDTAAAEVDRVRVVTMIAATMIEATTTEAMTSGAEEVVLA
jgi:hypothetical protein